MFSFYIRNEEQVINNRILISLCFKLLTKITADKTEIIFKNIEIRITFINPCNSEAEEQQGWREERNSKYIFQTVEWVRRTWMMFHANKIFILGIRIKQRAVELVELLEFRTKYFGAFDGPILSLPKDIFAFDHSKNRYNKVSFTQNLSYNRFCICSPTQIFGGSLTM